MTFAGFILVVIAAAQVQSPTPQVTPQQPDSVLYKVCGKTTPPDHACATAPRVVYSPNPEYSNEARSARVQGTVVLYAVIAADGKPRDIKIARALGRGLDEQAVEAVRQWRFKPGEVNGKPVDVAINVEVNFRLYGQPPTPDPIQGYSQLYAMAQAAYSNHEYEECIALLQQIAGSYPRHGSVWNLMGLAYLELDDMEEARRAFLQSIKVDPASLYAYNNLGRVLLREKKYPEAVTQFQKQLELNPKDQFAHANIGIALLSMRKYSDAVPELLLGIQAQPEKTSTRIHLAECYLNIGQQEKAMAELQSAVSMASNASVWNSAAWVLAKSRKELEIAQQYASTAMTIDSAALMQSSLDPLGRAPFARAASFLGTLDTLGWIQFLRGDVEHALQNLLTSWQFVEEPVIADHLAELYQTRHDDINAARYSALAIISAKALSFPSTDDEDAVSASQNRLQLLGGSRYDDLLAAAQKELDAQHTLAISNSAKQSGDAEFAMLVGGHKETKARFVRGTESLRALESSLPTAIQSSPGEYTLVRWTKVHCDVGVQQCRLTMLPARQALLAQARKPSLTSTLHTLTDPSIFNSANLGMQFAIPEGWDKATEEHHPEVGSDRVLFYKPFTMAMLTFGRQHLEVNSETYLGYLEDRLKKVGNYRRLSVASVVRDGLEGTRLIYNAEEEGVAWYGFIEVFTVGDQHYTVVGQSPRDMYSRYASEFDLALRSLKFPMHHVSSSDLQINH